MTPEEIQQLSNLLDNWFKTVRNDSDFWQRNEIGRKIKKSLDDFGHWKLKPRGNPRKGKEMMDYSDAVNKHGYSGPPPFKPSSPHAKFYKSL